MPYLTNAAREMSQNEGRRNTATIPLIGPLDRLLSPRGVVSTVRCSLEESFTALKIHMVVTRCTRAIKRKAFLQPTASTAAARGVVAPILPSVPIERKILEYESGRQPLYQHKLFASGFRLENEFTKIISAEISPLRSTLTSSTTWSIETIGHKISQCHNLSLFC